MCIESTKVRTAWNIAFLARKNKGKSQIITIPHKIAVVEDEISIAAMYRFKLEQAGYKVQVAHNGHQGLEVIKDFRPSLILLDLRMPIMNGDEMLEKLRTHDWAGDIRVIVLTNISRDEAPQKLRLLNVDRYIVKAHSTPSQIVRIVEEVLAS